MGRQHSSAVTTQRRVDDVVRWRLGGVGELWDMRERLAALEREPGSAWFLAEGETPLSDGQLRRYQRAADRAVRRTVERKRERLIALTIARLERLYWLANQAGDLLAALKVLNLKCELLGLYPLMKNGRYLPDPPKPIEFIIEVVHAPCCSGGTCAPAG